MSWVLFWNLFIFPHYISVKSHTKTHFALYGVFMILARKWKKGSIRKYVAYISNPIKADFLLEQYNYGRRSLHTTGVIKWQSQTSPVIVMCPSASWGCYIFWSFQKYHQTKMCSYNHFVLGMSWWRHQMETFSALLAFCAGNSPVIGVFPTQRPVTRSFDVFFICTWING